MLVEQHYLACLSQASYLVVDEATKTALVIDPRRDVDIYVQRAKELGVTIRHVLLTHLHADFVAGHLELVRRTGATVHLSGDAGAEYAHEVLVDGQTLEFGSVRLVVLETPGHTPESLCFLLFDLDVSDSVPHAVFTGDTLFIGDVGRPDLMSAAGHTATDLARRMFTSLQTKLLPLPDETILYPGHGAGSACGKNLSSATVCSIGQQRRTNYALQFTDVDEFVAAVTANQSQAPAYFAYDAVMNKRERANLDDALAEGLVGLTLDEFLAKRDAGAWVLDVRDAESFAAGHLPGSVNIPLGGRFASWVGSLLFEASEVVLVAESGLEREAALRMGRVGMDRVVGFLQGGPGAFDQTREPLATTTRIDPDDAARLLGDSTRVHVLDVRMPGEFAAGHAEGATHVPLAQLEQRLDELPRDRTLVLFCKTSYRSSIAASLLARHGITDTLDLRGGMDEWLARGLPTVVPAATH